MTAQTVDFGDVVVGSFRDSSITVTNPYPITVSITAMYLLHSPSDFSIVSGGAPFSVKPGTSHSVTLRFAPSVPGLRTDSLVLEGPFPGSPAYVELRGNGTALPVELTAFSAVRTPEGVHVRWTTAAESNNMGFEVERRWCTTDDAAGSRYVAITFIRGAGTTTLPHAYDIVDPDAGLPPAGVVAAMYRLRQLDADGTSSRSHAILCLLDASVPHSGPRIISISPNPARADMRITVDVPDARMTPLALVDPVGRIVAIVSSRGDSGIRSTIIDVSGLPSGIYFVAFLAAGSNGARPVRIFH